MASAFKEPMKIVAYRKGEPSVVYLFDSANKAAAFTHADVKSIMEVCRAKRMTAMQWVFHFDGSLGAGLLKREAKKLVTSFGVIER